MCNLFGMSLYYLFLKVRNGNSTLHPLQVWTNYLVVGDRRKDEDHPAGSNSKPFKNPWQSYSVTS